VPSHFAVEPRRRSQDFFHKLKRFKFSIASTGLWRSLADLIAMALAEDPGKDRTFDRAFGTDTSGSVAAADLGIANPERRDQAILYLPSPTKVTKWMLENVGIRHDEFSFVDLGCGKGRVLLIAAGYPFRSVVGVEISPQLSEIARGNIARQNPASRLCRDVTVRNTDALQFDFPDTNLLLHLYHPFAPVVTSGVLARLERSVQAAPRKVVVAYLLYAAAFDAVDATFSEFPWLRRVRYEQSLPGRYNWLVYSNSL
jgi:SAM-dependent methyltransferase